MRGCNQICNLHSALERLRSIPGQLAEADVQVDLTAELVGVYRHVEAGGTVMWPIRSGPAILFNQIKGHPGARVAIDLLADRRRVAALLDSRPKELDKLLRDSINHSVEPALDSGGAPLCQQVIHRAEDPDFGLRRLVPAPTNTPDDAGSYITLGMCYTSHPDIGVSDVTIHRLYLQGRDELSIFFAPSIRHISAMTEWMEQLGQHLPISISIGMDPAIEIASCFELPTTPLGFNELSITGALRGQAVELAPCLTVKENCVANAEYVIEGEIIPGVRVQEDQNSHTGYAIPEFPGYISLANDQCWLIEVKAVTHRRGLVVQTYIDPSEEHVFMAGIPVEASTLDMMNKAMPGRLQDVYCASAGGGKFMAVLQFKKSVPSDERRQRQAALLTSSAFSELRHIFLVDEDVNLFDMSDILWAMNARLQGDADILTIPGVHCHPLDPSNDSGCSPSIRDHGITYKTVFDCTAPFGQEERFHRAHFLGVDPAHWVPKLFPEVWSWRIDG